MTGTHPLYRLNQPLNLDHMDSQLTNESGYSMESLLGYAYDAQVSGTCGIKRWFKGSIYDHMTARCNETPSGYTAEGILGYGFARYGNQCEVPLTVTGNTVSMVANLAAGGAISELTWNGKQFINNYDYGRQIQTALNLVFGSEEDNPTEGGDRYGCPGAVSAGWAHGSPLTTHHSSALL